MRDGPVEFDRIETVNCVNSELIVSLKNTQVGIYQVRASYPVSDDMLCKIEPLQQEPSFHILPKKQQDAVHLLVSVVYGLTFEYPFDQPLVTHL